ncbi:glycoprotein [Bactrocera dorsalis borna-like virus]|nr:glycoprotein [Bactrocera dorsalis borna-like virus]
MYKSTYLLLLLSLSRLIQVSAIIGFDCTDPSSNVTAVSLTQIGDCVVRNRNVTTTTTNIRVYQSLDFTMTTVYSCLIEMSHIISRCGKSIDQFHSGGFYSEIPSITRATCLDMIDTGKINLHGNSMEGIEVGVPYSVALMTYGTIDQDGSCTTPGDLIVNGRVFTRAIRNTNIKILVTKYQANVDIDQSELKLSTGIVCPFLKRECFSAQTGYNYWNSFLENIVCEGTRPLVQLYEGPATKAIESINSHPIQTYMFKRDKSDFAIGANNPGQFCGYNDIIQTDHPNLYIVEEKNWNLVKLKTRKLMTTDIDITAYMNSKMLYIVNHVTNQVNNLYDAYLKDRCKTEESVLRQTLTLAYMSPNDFAYDFMKGPGYTATVSGEVIYIIKCQAKSVNYRPVSETCYKELPVLIDNKPGFVMPKTHLITMIGTEIPCNPLLPPVFLLGEYWYSPSHQLIRSTPPLVLKPSEPHVWQFEQISNLISSGIYSAEDLHLYRKAFLAPDGEKAFIGTFAKKTIRWNGDDYTGNVVNSFNEHDIDLLNERLGNWFHNMYRKLGNFGSFMVSIFIIGRFLLWIINLFLNCVKLRMEGRPMTDGLFVWWDRMLDFMQVRRMYVQRKQQDKTDAQHETALREILSDP